MQFYGISFTHPYKQFVRWQDVLDEAARTSLPKDEHLNVRNISKTS